VTLALDSSSGMSIWVRSNSTSAGLLPTPAPNTPEAQTHSEHGLFGKPGVPGKSAGCLGEEERRHNPTEQPYRTSGSLRNLRLFLRSLPCPPCYSRNSEASSFPLSPHTHPP
jgi:hypothetical protein